MVMKTVKHSLFLSLAVVILIAGSAAGQAGPPGNERNQMAPQENPRRNLFRQLGLNQAQLRQIGQLNRRRRPLMEEAQTRFREANRRLDEAIYSDQLNEADVQERIKEVQISQAELVRLRSMSELSIRKVLTPEQLIRFRRMRQRYDQSNIRGGALRPEGAVRPGAGLPRDE